MLLTATATTSIIKEVLHLLHLKETDIETVAHIPDRPNIHLSLERTTSTDFKEYLKDYLEILKREKDKAPKAIIYTQSVTKVAEIWGWMQTELGNHPAAGRLCEMYHASTDHKSQSRITLTLPQAGSRLRCVVATVAFGLGIDLPDVEYVFHWGVPSDVMAYWQEVGRCARDGRAGKAKMYITPSSLFLSRVDEKFVKMITAVESGQLCLRRGVLDNLFVPGMSKDSLKSCSANADSCCFVCDKNKE
eukprot:XP_011677380.1 PREDICTED: Werner syndrome ATP-dependent helicase homolog [Strongylocentrotus purpuratus]